MNRLERLMLVLGMTDRLSGPLNRIQSTVSRVTSHARKAFMNTAAGVTALVAASSGFAATLNPAIDMNNALSEVRSLEVAESTLAQLNQAGLQYSIEFGESAQGYVNGAYAIQSAIDGLVGDDLPRFTTAAGQLAKATKANMGEITNYFGSMYGIFRNQANKMGKANWIEMMAGRTATAIQKFKTSGSEMAAAFGALGADATSYGVDMAEQMAILGNLQSTMSGSEAGTKYRSYLAGVSNAEKTLGLSFSDESGKLLPVVEVLNRIQGKFGDIDTLAKGDLLKKAFGSDEATAFLKLLSTDINKVSNDINELSNIKGMEKAIWMAEQMKDPWSSFSSGITAVSIAIYQKVLPSIEPFIYWMISGLKTITSWSDKYPHLTKAVGLFAVGLFALVSVGGIFTLAVGLMQFAMAGFIFTAAGLKMVAAGFSLLTGGLWSAVTATWGFTAALLANPLTWIVLAVIALIAGLVLLVVYWDEVAAAFMRFIQPIMPMLELVKAAWDVFTAAMSAMNPFKLLGDALDWIIKKINLIPGVNIDLGIDDSEPDLNLPVIKQAVELNPIQAAVPPTLPPESQSVVPVSPMSHRVHVAEQHNADMQDQHRMSQEQQQALNPKELSQSTQAHVDQGGLMQTYNQSQSTRNNSKTNHVEKIEVHNHGEPVRADDLMYELEMMS